MTKVEILNNYEIFEIFEIFEKNNPNPTTELNYFNEATLLISVMLSAQTTDKMVNRVTKNLFIKYNTFELFANLEIQELEREISKIGLFRQKSKNIVNTCKILLSDYNGKIPSRIDDLIKLPGIGRKTANLILNTLFGLKVIAVDTHVYRVSRRLGLSFEKNIKKLEDEITSKIPKKYLNNAHYWLVLHGRYVCKSRNPDCKNCILSSICKKYI